MGDPPPLRVDTPRLTWDPADVTVPAVPTIPAGGDPMSQMISAIMPELAARLTAAVAATRAREEQFAANLAAARDAYQSADQAGEQEIRAVADTQLTPADIHVSPAKLSPANSEALRSMGGQSGQLIGTAMQTAGQAAQAPMQLAGAAAAGAQGILQGVVQQLGLPSGPPGKTESKDDGAEDDDEDRTAQSEEPGPRSQVQEQRPPNADDGVASGGPSTERAPVGAPLPAQTPGRQRLDDPT